MPGQNPITQRRLNLAVTFFYAATFSIVSVCITKLSGLIFWWDFYNYGYSSGYSFFHGFGGVYSLVGQYQTFLTPQLNGLYFFLESSFGSQTQELCIAFLESWTVTAIAYLVFRTATRKKMSTVDSIAVGLACGVSALLSPIFISELGGTMSDTLVAGVVITGYALIAKSFLVESDFIARRTLVFGGAVLGLSVVLKFTSVIYALTALIALALALLFNTKRFGVGKAMCRWLLAFFTLIGTWSILYFPQGMELWSKYRNPMFPFFNGFFHSPLQFHSNLRDGRFAVHNLGDWWHNLWGLVRGTDMLQSGVLIVRAPNLVFIIAIMLILLLENIVRRRDPFLLFVESSVVIAFGIWSYQVVLFRYGAPLLLSIGSVLVVCLIYRSMGRRAWVYAALALICVLGLTATGGATSSHDKDLKSHFTIDQTVVSQSRINVMFVGGNALGFIYPSLSPESKVVRIGGNLIVTMSLEYWRQTSDYIAQQKGPWSLYVDERELESVPDLMASLQLSGRLGVCVPAASWRHAVVLRCEFDINHHVFP